MSYRPPSRNVKRGQPQRVRGASRPIDPRYAPGGPPRRGIDGFVIGLVAVSVVAIFLVVLVIALQPKTTGTTTTTSFDPSATTAALDPAAAVTATAVTFATITADLPRISVAEAKALYDANNVKIIDVREEQFYTTSHIKGAISIPQATAHDRLNDIPKSGNVVVYCDCPHDEESLGVAYSLRTVGYNNVQVLEGPRAMELWQQAGYPMEP